MQEEALTDSRSWTQNLASYLRPPRKLRSTTMGKTVILFTILIGVAAINTGNNLLYLLLGGLFGMIASSGILSERVLRLIDCVIWAPNVLIAGQSSYCVVELKPNKKNTSFLLWIELLDENEDLIGSCFVPELLPGTSSQVRVKIRARKRGELQIRYVRYVTRFPFQMYEKSRLEEVDARTWVAPKPAKVALAKKPPAQGDDYSPIVSRRAGDEFAGLREFEPTDSFTRVHWKRFAAIGEPVVKVFTDGDRQRLVLELTRGSERREFERALSKIVGYGLEAQRQDMGIELRAGNQEFLVDGQGAAWEQMLVFLAQVQRKQMPKGAPSLQLGNGYAEVDA